MEQVLIETQLFPLSLLYSLNYFLVINQNLI